MIASGSRDISLDNKGINFISEPEFEEVGNILLEVRDLVIDYAGRKRAVDSISFTLEKGKTTGLVGESGSGKSTTAHALVRLLQPTSGRILYRGRDILEMSQKDSFQFRKAIQMIFQDPHASLSPASKIAQIMEEPLRIHFPHWTRKRRMKRIGQLLSLVGIDQSSLDRFPHQFSGGQKQRIGIARALAVEPELLICDEPVSALDVSIQAQIINLLQDIQDQLELTYLIIAHDLTVIEHVSDTVLVMYQGKIVEQADSEQLFSAAQHTYTRKLLSAIPEFQRGDVPG